MVSTSTTGSQTHPRPTRSAEPMPATATPEAPPAPAANDTAVVPPDSTVHAYCLRCLDMTAPVSLCGHRPGTLHGIVPPPDQPRCIVCADLRDNPCPRCGS